MQKMLDFHMSQRTVLLDKRQKNCKLLDRFELLFRANQRVKILYLYSELIDSDIRASAHKIRTNQKVYS